MNILVATGLYPPEGGGPATYAKTLFDELPKRGIGVEIVPFREVRKYPKIIRHIAYFFIILKRGKGSDVLYALDPASVGFPTALAAFFLRKTFVVKIVGDYAWEQGMQRFGIKDLLDDFVQKKYGVRIGLLRFIQTFVAKRAEKIIVPSEYLKRIVSAWGIEGEKIQVIYNAAPNVENIGNKKVLRGLLKYHGKYVITVARLVPWKGIAELIDAVHSLRERGVEVRLLIVGSGREQERLEARAGEGEGVMFTGQLPNDVTLAYMKASDVFVLNSGYEGFSHLLLEAQALGIPTVATNIGGNPELIQNGQNGLLVPYKDTKALEKAISRALSDEPFRRNASQRAKRKAAKFSKDRMLTETHDMLVAL